jgi:hypothetical protein
MDLTLYRQVFDSTGIYGVMGDFQTLEHAYPGQPTGWVPKVPPGAYVCVLYPSPKRGYEVWMLKDVPGHDHIEIHRGNFNHDSDGCILIGTTRIEGGIGGSKDAFEKFMAMQAECTQFTLTIV